MQSLPLIGYGSANIVWSCDLNRSVKPSRLRTSCRNRAQAHLKLNLVSKSGWILTRRKPTYAGGGSVSGVEMLDTLVTDVG